MPKRGKLIALFVIMIWVGMPAHIINGQLHKITSDTLVVADSLPTGTLRMGCPVVLVEDSIVLIFNEKTSFVHQFCLPGHKSIKRHSIKNHYYSMGINVLGETPYFITRTEVANSESMGSSLLFKWKSKEYMSGSLYSVTLPFSLSKINVTDDLFAVAKMYDLKNYGKHNNKLVYIFPKKRGKTSMYFFDSYSISKPLVSDQLDHQTLTSLTDSNTFFTHHFTAAETREYSMASGLPVLKRTISADAPVFDTLGWNRTAFMCDGPFADLSSIKRLANSSFIENIYWLSGPQKLVRVWKTASDPGWADYIFPNPSATRDSARNALLRYVFDQDRIVEIVNSDGQTESRTRLSGPIRLVGGGKNTLTFLTHFYPDRIILENYQYYSNSPLKTYTDN